ncbi:ATP-dependent DNA helicase RRM3 [Eumeta japonica]|uniref:ATP-dependent DNA helicase n=1 Tax=Eumeta variegata TaxID=151549 RepID=A0A4C1TBL2_EUMVA|nr:ATP-dependent DNA helicase RRM3 [Eumeta japonica]
MVIQNIEEELLTLVVSRFKLNDFEVDNRWVVPYNPINKGSVQAAFSLENDKDESACLAMGLLEDDKHWDETPEEVAVSDHPAKLRDLFAILLKNWQISNASTLWEKHKDNLSKDIKKIRKKRGELVVQYGLPVPRTLHQVAINAELLAETNYDANMLNKDVTLQEKYLTIDQQKLYNINNSKGQMLFTDVPGGTGKTYLLNLLLTKVRSQGNIALAVASSGIAATLLVEERTAHATFKIPLDLNRLETPICKISKQSNLAEVIRACKLIVWDESTMAHKGGLEALNRALQDIKSNNFLMGGITVLLTGDFRQTLQVLPKGTLADEVRHVLNHQFCGAL